MPWRISNWDDFRFLLAVHRSGTMTAAATRLGTNVATVSRRIERISEVLGYPPFIKTPEGWITNPNLIELLETVESFDASLNREVIKSSNVETRRRVQVRIGLPPIISTQILFPMLSEALASMESVDLVFTNRLLSEGLGDHDIALQTTRPDTGRVVTKRIGTMDFAYFGAEKHSAHPDDWVSLLADYDDAPLLVIGQEMFKREPRIRTNSFDHLFEVVARTGLPGPLPVSMAARLPEFVQIGGKESKMSIEFWALYHESRRGDEHIRAVIDWIESCFLKANQVSSAA